MHVSTQYVSLVIHSNAYLQVKNKIIYITVKHEVDYRSSYNYWEISNKITSITRPRVWRAGRPVVTTPPPPPHPTKVHTIFLCGYIYTNRCSESFSRSTLSGFSSVDIIKLHETMKHYVGIYIPVGNGYCICYRYNNNS